MTIRNRSRNFLPPGCPAHLEVIGHFWSDLSNLPVSPYLLSQFCLHSFLAGGSEKCSLDQIRSGDVESNSIVINEHIWCHHSLLPQSFASPQQLPGFVSCLFFSSFPPSLHIEVFFFWGGLGWWFCFSRFEHISKKSAVIYPMCKSLLFSNSSPLFIFHATICTV